MSRSPAVRRLAVAAVAAGAILAGLPDAAAAGGPVATGPLADRACGQLSHEELLRVWRGQRFARSGEILIVPREPNYVNGGLSHAGPWDYIQRVPMFLYGPGYIRSRGQVGRSVNMATVAPTLANLLGFDGLGDVDGGVLYEALVPASDRPDPPRLIMVVVWDGGGRNVLSRWPLSWPNLKGLKASGTWYENAVDGTSPSVTSPVHATLGTGVWPLRHGLTDSQIRGSGGGIIDSWSQGPRNLLKPTLADLYDAANGNQPKVALLAHESWHLGMIGHGSQRTGGDRDVAATHEGVDGFNWAVPHASQPYFLLAGEANAVGGIAEDKQAIDVADGEDDEAWRNHPFSTLDAGFNTPARLPYQTRVIERIIDERNFGDDATPDLFFTNYKLIDGSAHRFGMNSLEEKDTVLWTDRELPRLIDVLDEHAGEGNWVLLLTADHGVNPENPAAFSIGVPRLADDLARAFDDGDAVKLVQKIRPTHIFVNTAEASQLGVTLGEISTWLNHYTEAESLSDRLGTAAANEVFSAAFPRSLITRLACLPEARG